MSLDELDPGDRMMVEGLYWWGVPSLFRCPVDAGPCRLRPRARRSPARLGQRVDGARPAPRAARRPSRLGRATALPRGLRLLPVGGVPDPRPGRRAVPRGERQRALHRADHGLLRTRREGRDAHGGDRGRPLGDRGHRPGAGERGLEAHRRSQGRAAPPRCPHRRLRVDSALAGREEICCALGELPRPPGSGRPGAQRPDRDPRQSPHAPTGWGRATSSATR